MGSNAWVNSTVTDNFLVTMVLPLPINLGFNPNWAILYSGAAQSHLVYLDHFEDRIKNMYGITFTSLITHHNALILGLTCHLLAGEG